MKATKYLLCLILGFAAQALWAKSDLSELYVAKPRVASPTVGLVAIPSKGIVSYSKWDSAGNKTAISKAEYDEFNEDEPKLRRAFLLSPNAETFSRMSESERRYFLEMALGFGRNEEIGLSNVVALNLKSEAEISTMDSKSQKELSEKADKIAESVRGHLKAKFDALSPEERMDLFLNANGSYSSYPKGVSTLDYIQRYVPEVKSAESVADLLCKGIQKYIDNNKSWDSSKKAMVAEDGNDANFRFLRAVMLEHPQKQVLQTKQCYLQDSQGYRSASLKSMIESLKPKEDLESDSDSVGSSSVLAVGSGSAPMRTKAVCTEGQLQQILTGAVSPMMLDKFASRTMSGSEVLGACQLKGIIAKDKMGRFTFEPDLGPFGDKIVLPFTWEDRNKFYQLLANNKIVKLVKDAPANVVTASPAVTPTNTVAAEGASGLQALPAANTEIGNAGYNPFGSTKIQMGTK